MNDENEPYNPLDLKSIGIQLALRLLQSKPKPLPPKEFVGAGVYAIFYVGKDPLYAKLGKINRENDCVWPIYVGKAVPAGTRKGVSLDDKNDGNKALFGRLSEHSKSILSTKTLRLQDFKCKYLIVDDIWIPLAETMVITQYKPVWNCLLDGFGNHDPGKGRYQGKIPSWDIVHPGRDWAQKLEKSDLTYEDLKTKISDYLETNVKYPPFEDDF